MQKVGLFGWLVFSSTFAGSLAFGQTAGAQLTFDVASVKAADPAASGRGRGGGPNGGPIVIRGIRGGPGTDDPGRLTYSSMPLKQIVVNAYSVKAYQVNGPAWMDTELYDIVAKVPAGATKEQCNIMLQNLLKERFNLTLHHETKEQNVYELVVGKNGSKLKDADVPADLPPAPEPGTPMRMTPDKDGFPNVPAGRPGMIGMGSAGLMKMVGRMQPISGLTNMIENMLDRPIVDKTGLTGTYDFKFAFATDGLAGPFARLGAQAAALSGAAGAPNAPPPDQPSDGGVTIFAAVQDQLGLKLEAKKDPIDYLVIDRADKTPTDN